MRESIAWMNGIFVLQFLDKSDIKSNSNSNGENIVWQRLFGIDMARL